MQFASLDMIFKGCEAHLDATNTRGSEIENYFVQFLLIRICAEYEMRIALMVERRCSRSRDAHLRRFSKRSAKRETRNFNIGDIAGTLGFFGDDYKNNFQKIIHQSVAHQAWDNIYSNRQAVAHRAGVTMSFPDLQKQYGESLLVLDALVATLGLRPKETFDLT